MNPVRFGLVGAGAISQQHAEAIAALDGATLTGVMSASEERARAAGERWDVPWTTDLDELLGREDIDAVAILTPSGLHAGQALAALAHGKHVLVEKPLALSVADADAVIAEAERRRRWLGTISQRRFEPVMERLRAAIASDLLGRLVLVFGEGLYHRPQSYYDSAGWRGTRALDGGVLMNQAIHMVDLVRWMGGAVTSVGGHVATLGHRMEAEDTATVSLRFAGGALGDIVATTCAEPGFEQELRVYGDAGHVRIVGDRAVEWTLSDGSLPPAPDAQPAAASQTAAAAEPRAAVWGTDSTGHTRQYADFVAAIRENRPPAITGQDGRAAVAIVTAAYEADRTGRAIALEEGS